MKNIIGLLGTVLFLAGCAARVTVDLAVDRPPLEYTQEVKVLQLNDEVPPGAQRIGTVKVGDAGLTLDCDYPLMIEKAEIAARKAGGNLIKIIEHQTPDFKSSCHRITAQILYLQNIDEVLAEFSPSEAYFDTTANYALLHVYRSSGVGPLVIYMLHLGDRELIRVPFGCHETIMITEEGTHELWARTESKSTVMIDFEHGREYYLRCGVAMGFMVGRPTLSLVDNTTGKNEFGILEGKKQ